MFSNVGHRNINVWMIVVTLSSSGVNVNGLVGGLLRSIIYLLCKETSIYFKVQDIHDFILWILSRQLINLTNNKDSTGLLGFWISFIMNIPKNTTFVKLDLSPPSGEGTEDIFPIGSVKKADLSHWRVYVSINCNGPSREGISHLPRQRTNISSFWNVFFGIINNEQSPKTQ
jgi:hypothetical protein